MTEGFGERREKQRNEKNREGVHMSWKTTTGKYLISYSVCSVIVCQTVLLYSWHQPSLPVCYHNKTINVKQLPHTVRHHTFVRNTIKILLSTFLFLLKFMLREKTLMLYLILQINMSFVSVSKRFTSDISFFSFLVPNIA